MRITRDKIYYQFIPEIEPVVSISPGDRLTVETLDAGGGYAYGNYKKYAGGKK